MWTDSRVFSESNIAINNEFVWWAVFYAMSDYIWYFMYVHDWIDFQVNGFDKKKGGGFVLYSVWLSDSSWSFPYWT